MKQNRSYKKTAARKSTGTGRTVRQARSTAIAGRTGNVTLKRANATDDIQFVLPLGNGWVVKASKAHTFTAITDSKTEAISIARSLARTKHMKMIVHGRNGAIEIRENYVV
jgi:hypothetical protein